MTEQEFRDKIAKIIENDHCIRADYSDCEGCEYKNCFSCKPYRLADALIAAGLTFDKTKAILAERANSKTLIQKAQYYDQMKHRAEVAERALCNALNDDSCYFCNKKSPCECEHRDWGSKECITVLLRQAEQELAEEGKE